MECRRLSSGRPASQPCRWRRSGSEAEMHDVAVGDDVILAFEPEFAGLAGACLAVAGDVVVVGDGLGADETLLEIGVDDAGCLRRARAARHGPGTGLLRPGREIGD